MISLAPKDGFASAETPWQGEKYSIIYIDPPWKYGNYTDKAHGAAAAHYDSMTIEQLGQLDIAQLADEDCTLCMWATWPKLDEAMKIGEKWGFRYITGFPWIKFVPRITEARGFYRGPDEPDKNGIGSALHVQRGCGFVVMQCSEPLLWWRRGDPSRDPAATKQIGLLVGMDQRTFWAPRGQHSRKPPEIREQLAQEFPNGKRLELFATETCPGWTSWGDTLGTILVPGTPGVMYANPTRALSGLPAAVSAQELCLKYGL